MPKIYARTECSPRPGEYDGTNGRVPISGQELCRRTVGQIGVQGVELVWAIECHYPN